MRTRALICLWNWRQSIVYGNHDRRNGSIVVLDDQRFFGDVGFRQNQQTVDALTLQASTPGGSRFIYAFLDQVNDEDHECTVHVKKRGATSRGCK
jgi:hypothetical protein